MSQSGASRGDKPIYQDLETGQLYLRTLVPYLEYPFKEAIYDSNQIKEQH